MTRTSLTAALFGLLLLTPPGVVRADAEPHAADAAPPTARREVPDYDGREEPGPDAIDALLWVPRIITSPLYLVTEFVIRRPIGWLITELERSDALLYLLGLFTFGGRQDLVVVPTAFFDFGFQPSIGLFGAWNRALFDDNRISLHAATGGEDFLMIAAADTVRLPDGMQLRFRFNAVRRPDQQVGGVGYDATRARVARYGIETIEGGGRFGLRPWAGIEIDFLVDYRGVGYVEGAWGGDPSVGQVGRALGAYETGYSSIALGTRIVIDSRAGCAAAGASSGWEVAESVASPDGELPDGHCELSSGGVRVAVDASERFGFGGLPSSQWLRVGGELAAGTDFLGRGRVLSIRGRVHMVEPLGGARIVPFTELFSLSDTMRGFLPGRVLGATVAAVHLEYAWPIWAFLDGALHVAVGNAFAERFEDFEFERLRMSFGVHIAPRVGGDHFFELGVAFGTETFVRGADVTSVRFVIGGRNAL